MTATAYERIIDALRDLGSLIKECNGYTMAQCPAHDDSTPSLSIKAIEGSVLLKCQAGCDTADVVAALRMTMRDLYDDRTGREYQYPGGRIVNRYYPRGSNRKAFAQKGNKEDTSLYGSERITADTKVILVVEGEQDVDAAHAIEVVAVSSPMGAGKASKADWSCCYGYPILIVADKDKPGHEHAEDVKLLLEGHVPALRIVEAAEGCKDLAEHIATGHDLNELVPYEPPDPTEIRIEQQLDWMRIRAEAKRRLDDEQRPQAVTPPIKSLPALLAEPDTATRFLIDEVAPIDSRGILSAQYKAGKTIIVGNLMRALADSDPFLGRFNVNSSSTRIVLIDDELSENMLRRWLRDQQIVNTAAVVDVVSLRGRVSAFNLLDDRRRSEWAARLRGLRCDYLIVDCLRPVLDTLGLDENRETGRFLVQFDALLAAAHVTDALLIHHMGHANERARGDSRLEDWPDMIWRLVREDPDDPSSARYFSAVGRDVSVPEGHLSYDPATRRLTYAAGSRHDVKTEAAKLAVITLLAKHANTDKPSLSKNEIEDELRGEHTQKAIREGLTLAVNGGLVTESGGPRRAKLNRIAYPCAQCGLPVINKTERHWSCPPNVEELLL